MKIVYNKQQPNKYFEVINELECSLMLLDLTSFFVSVCDTKRAYNFVFMFLDLLGINNNTYMNFLFLCRFQVCM